MIFTFHFESSSRSRANSCKLTQVCLRGIALYAAMLCSLYKFVKCGPLVNAVCRLVIQGFMFQSVALTKCMQLHGLKSASNPPARIVQSRLHFILTAHWKNFIRTSIKLDIAMFAETSQNLKTLYASCALNSIHETTRIRFFFLPRCSHTWELASAFFGA
jgi:hypothetical protein